MTPKEFIIDVLSDMKTHPKEWLGGLACMVILATLFVGALQLA